MPANTNTATGPSKKFLGFFNRRERWGLSRCGWMALGVALVAFAFLLVLKIQPFLAVTNKVHGQFLVVEGWIPPETLKYAVAEFKAGDYQKILTSGCVVRGHMDSDAKITYADWAASDLRKIGMAAALIQSIPCWEERRDRTYSSALAVKVCLAEQHIQVKSINVMTLSAHARRSRLLFQEAFGGDVQVGVIAIPDPDYDAKHWWSYSEGVRDVLSESIAYIYAKFFFWPSAQS
jgi:hypothetical protein